MFGCLEGGIFLEKTQGTQTKVVVTKHESLNESWRVFSSNDCFFWEVKKGPYNFCCTKIKVLGQDLNIVEGLQYLLFCKKNTLTVTDWPGIFMESLRQI